MAVLQIQQIADEVIEWRRRNETVRHMSHLGHEAKFPSDKRMSALALKSGHLSFYEYTP